MSVPYILVRLWPCYARPVTAIKPILAGWTPLRSRALPVAVPETDWRATNDVAGFLATAGAHAIVPKGAGLGALQICLTYLDASGALVIPDNLARVDLELLELVNTPPSEVPDVLAQSILIRAADDLVTRGEQIVPVPDIGLFFQTVLGFRILSTQAEPIGATSVTLNGRYA